MVSLSREYASSKYRVEFIDSITAVQQVDWNRLAGDASPFLRHEFLLALELSGCTDRASGWQPHHAVVHLNTDDNQEPQPAKQGQGSPIAIVPLYLKSNSYGEYVFDWSWADAYRANGIPYFPKFLTAVPFTPSTGDRILVDPPHYTMELLDSLVSAIRTDGEQYGVSSWHVLFPTQQQCHDLSKLGLMQRQGCQYHWFNRNYRNFNDYLEAMSSRKRKNIRKERDSVREQGIQFEILQGIQIKEANWQRFYEFYQRTYNIRGREGYLNLEFFTRLGSTMPENLVLVNACAGQHVIAAALFFKDQQKLYGRYWGSLEEYQFLHFETCYYQGIEYCIDNDLQQFDAGAQGEHKIARGFEPLVTYSGHWIANDLFATAIKEFIEEESRYIRLYVQEAEKRLPFKTRKTST